eukprot:CAMPEP_0113944106 /NCGR_PEP_ID=MMETSP1339-20121228/30642_1 /TAXON_ID=94617 /ORGANISM="Fibrocapsa japonica" /LENGTH=180 /DNA_ID=CAMNT_0000949177 /DNA_START=43 /DNA_END=582 /DNA_ORIENTATION=+ /assembly_acc=CAM_ASM_000762
MEGIEGMNLIQEGEYEDSSQGTGDFQVGYSGSEGKLANPTDRVKRVSWSKATTQGYRIGARGGHSAVVADYQLIVFGGHHYEGKGEFKCVNETCVLDIETATWQLVRCGGELPQPRYGHCCELVGSRMFVFGGRGAGETGRPLRDIHALDLVDWVWVPINATTQGPGPRFNHASARVGAK